MHENTPSVIKDCIDILETCFHFDPTSFLEDDELLTIDNSLNLNLPKLEHFFNCDGENILLTVKDHFSHNVDLLSRISTIEQRYFMLDIGAVSE